MLKGFVLGALPIIVIYLDVVRSDGWYDSLFGYFGVNNFFTYGLIGAVIGFLYSLCMNRNQRISKNLLLIIIIGYYILMTALLLFIIYMQMHAGHMG